MVLLSMELTENRLFASRLSTFGPLEDGEVELRCVGRSNQNGFSKKNLMEHGGTCALEMTFRRSGQLIH